MCKVFQIVGNQGYEIGAVENDKQLQELIEQLGLEQEAADGNIFVSQIDD